MSENDGWQYQGRQKHGWFGNGTKPMDAAAWTGGLPARARFAGDDKSWRWPGSRLVAERRLQPVSPLPFAAAAAAEPAHGA